MPTMRRTSSSAANVPASLRHGQLSLLAVRLMRNSGWCICMPRPSISSGQRLPECMPAGLAATRPTSAHGCRSRRAASRSSTAADQQQHAKLLARRCYAASRRGHLAFGSGVKLEQTASSWVCNNPTLLAVCAAVCLCDCAQQAHSVPFTHEHQVCIPGGWVVGGRGQRVLRQPGREDPLLQQPCQWHARGRDPVVAEQGQWNRQRQLHRHATGPRPAAPTCHTLDVPL